MFFFAKLQKMQDISNLSCIFSYVITTPVNRFLSKFFYVFGVLTMALQSYNPFSRAAIPNFRINFESLMSH